MAEQTRPLSTRIVDRTASTASDPLRNNGTTSLATSLSNASAKRVEQVKNLKKGLFSRFRGRQKGAGDRDDEEEPEPDGAFNAAKHAYEPELFKEIRDGWVKRHMQARLADYVSQEPFKVGVLTYNVAGKKPPSASAMSALLDPIANDCSLLVVGLQESVELTAQNVGAGASGPLSGGAVAWEAAITRAVREAPAEGAGSWPAESPPPPQRAAGADGGPAAADTLSAGTTSARFSQLVSRQMMGLVLLVYAREWLRPACGPVRVTSVGTGLLGLMGNKGAVAASLRIHSSTLCLVCSHLASGSSAVDARNLEYAQLLQRIAFPTAADASARGGGDESAAGGASGGGDSGEGGEGAAGRASASGGGGNGGGSEESPSSVLGHDFVLWFGDLNYRLDLDNEATRELAVRMQYDSLTAHDQLNKARHTRAAFGEFAEGPIRFGPTYKYDVGSDAFDTSEKRRPPAYCDRILYRAPPPLSARPSHAAPRIECHAYASRHEERTSDHRPVFASLTLRAAVPNEDERRKVAAEITRSLDAWENSCVPTATLDATDVDFGALRYGEPARRSLVLTNSGSTALTFAFERLPDAAGGQAMPHWLDVQPKSSLLTPGETCTIHLSALIVAPHATDLTQLAAARSSELAGGEAAPLTMDAILLLRLVHGRDYYVTTAASWRPSCIGMSLGAQPDASEAVAAALIAALDEAVGRTRQAASRAEDAAACAEKAACPKPLRRLPGAASGLVDSTGLADSGGKEESASEVGARADDAVPDVTDAPGDGGGGGGGGGDGGDSWGRGDEDDGAIAAGKEAADAARAATRAAAVLSEAFPEDALFARPLHAASPLVADVAAIIAALDGATGTPAVLSPMPSGARLAAAGYVLLRWTAALADAVVPAALIGAAEAAAPTRQAVFNIVRSLPPCHARVFEAIVLMLRRLLRVHARATSAAARAAAAAATLGVDNGDADGEAEVEVDTAAMAGWASEAVKPLPAEYLGVQPAAVKEVAAEAAHQGGAGAVGEAGGEGGDGPGGGGGNTIGATHFSPPRLALVARLCHLFGEALLRKPHLSGKKLVPAGVIAAADHSLLGAQAWWRGVFLKYFLDELKVEDEALEWRTPGTPRGATGQAE